MRGDQGIRICLLHPRQALLLCVRHGSSRAENKVFEFAPVRGGAAALVGARAPAAALVLALHFTLLPLVSLSASLVSLL